MVVKANKKLTINLMDYKKPNPSLYGVPYKTTDFHNMPYINLGKTGLQVPKVGLGTWKIGYPETGDKSRIGEKEAFQLFDRAVELGVTLWDTANRYNNASGNSERIIGKWLKNNPEQRRNVIIATKLYGGMDGVTPNHSGLSRENILNAIYASLERLQTEYIDVLYFHRFDPLCPIQESLASIEDLVKKDVIRYFGVSNFTVEQLKAYRSIENNRSVRSRIVAVQNQFDLLNGEGMDMEGVLEYAADMGISYVAWSPLAKGLLTGKYLDLSKVGPGDRLFDENKIEENTDESCMEKLQRLAVLSQEWGMTLSQLVLSHMLTMPGMGPVIPSSSNIQQLESNAEAGRIELTDDQKMQIKKVL
jgi:aryl-alcohol dehydrogenase-like predicted oxidoreductase